MIFYLFSTHFPVILERLKIKMYIRLMEMHKNILSFRTNITNVVEPRLSHGAHFLKPIASFS